MDGQNEMTAYTIPGIM